MPENQSSRDQSESDDRIDAVDRRTFIAAGSGVSAAILAGCTSDVSPSDADADSSGDDDTETTTNDADASGGNFRLLISDMPADIGDFERLDVSFDRARIFDGGGEESDEEESDEEQANGDEEEKTDDEEQADDGDGADDTDGKDDETEDGDEEDEKDDEESGDGVEQKRGFYVVDLEGATVDLTQVIGDKAKPVCDVGLSEGTYQKIELHVSDVEGIVDGEEVEVKVPSEKLQLTSPFEVSDDGSVDFVFDINVVKRGPDNGYNLKPVISKSGVNGEDVEVEEVGDEGDDSEDDTDDSNDDDGDGEADADDGEDDETTTEDETGENDDATEDGTGENGDDSEDDT